MGDVSRPGRTRLHAGRILRFVSQQQVRSLAGNSLWLVGERVFRLSLSLVVTGAIARHLGPANYSSLAFAVSLTALLLPFAQLGLSNVVIRNLVSRPAEAGAILGTALRLRSIAGVVTWLAASAATMALKPGSLSDFLVGSLVAAQLVLQTSEIVDMWFQRNLQSRRSVVARSVASIFANLLKLSLLLITTSLWLFAAAITIEYLLITLITWNAYRRYPTSSRWTYNRGWADSALRQAWPFLVSSASVAVYMRVDQIMLQELAGSYQLGLYAAVVSISQLWSIVPTSLSASLLPVLTKKHQEGAKEYYRAIRIIFLGFGLSGIVVSILTALAAPTLVRAIFGAAYQSATGILVIYAFTNVFVFMGTAQSIWVVSSGRGKILLANTLVGGITSIAGNFYLIPKMGALGAAIVANLSFAASAVLVNAITAPGIFFLQLGLTTRYLPRLT